MADELRQTAQGAITVYAVIRRISDGYAWNGTTFEAYVNANVATYDVALTDRGGDDYAADFPSGITTAGNYNVKYYKQAGATPAITDYLLGYKDLYWNGTVASSASEVAIDGNALCTLDELKRHLRITASDDDTLLTEVINRTSATIEHVTGRKFKARDYRHRLNGQCQQRLSLPQAPVLSITRIVYGSAQAMSITFTGSAIRANASVSDTGIKLVTISTAGVATSNHLLFTDYPSLSTMETAIEAITGWSVTVLTNMPTADLNRTGGEDCLNRTVFFNYPDRDDVEYEPDLDNGAVEFTRWGQFSWPRDEYGRGYYGRHFPRHFQGLLVEYRAGYETIPADVTQLCVEMCTDLFYKGLDNPSVKSSTMGPYSVTYSESEQFQVIRHRLSHYISAGGFIAGN